MPKYILNYSVCIEAEDENQAELISADLEGEIKHLHKWVLECSCDPYMEEVEE